MDSSTSPTNVLLYGKGVFTTIAIRDGEPFLWDKHWRRLVRDAKKIGIDLVDHSEASSCDELAKKLRETSCVEGRARITFHDETASELWSEGSEKRITLSIITAPPRNIAKPFRLTISPFPVNSQSPLCGVKSCNYLENILALDEARERGFDEAIRVNERGTVTGGCVSNIFWARDSQLFTPSLSTGCLAGTTREFVMERFYCRESEADVEVLTRADAIYLTSAGLGIAAISEFEGRELRVEEHPIIRAFDTM